jgi:2-keto-3-deoxy-L-rhamnonate aldolase RhmA
MDNLMIPIELSVLDSIDAVFCGPFDLSSSLRVFRQFDRSIFQKTVEAIVSTCKAHGVSPGLMAQA